MTALMESTAPATSLEVRERLVEALKLDLVGPWAGHALAEERLPGWVRPSNWYLTGFLIPSGTPPEKSADTDEDDACGEIPDSAGLAEESNEERKAAKKGFFPSSMGLSFLAPKEAGALTVTVHWGDYALAEIEGPDVVELRELHSAMDRAVLDAYGWSDIPTDCEFLLDYEIDDEEWGNKKKPWRYRWPDEVRDEVLARLLELNAERAKEEARSGAAAAKKHGRKPAKRAPKAPEPKDLFS